MKHSLRILGLVGLMSIGFISTAHAAACTVSVSNSVIGSVAPGGETVAAGPFAVNCDGSFSGSMQNLSSASMILELQKYVGGAWVAVASGYISYSGTAGSYRYSVRHLSGGTGSFKVTYRVPS